MVRPEEGELSFHLARFRRDLPVIFRAALDRSSPMALLDAAFTCSEVRDFLDRPVCLLSIGKAAAPLADALGRRSQGVLVNGLAVGTHRAGELPASVGWIAAGHPVPDDRSVEAARRALDCARRVPAAGRLLVLLSGGASSLAALPRAGLTLADKQAATRHLLGAGADIHSLNAVRKHLSAFKGGQLAAAAQAPVLALVISDVVDDDLSVIGSGPTVEDSSTFADALDVVSRHGGATRFPPAVVALLEAGVRGAVPETPKPGDLRLAHARTRLIGSRADAAAGAAAQAEALGYRTIVRREPVVGAAREAGPRVVAEAMRLALGCAEPVCVIATGETTVRVSGRGRGGRNQEVALSAARALAALTCPAALLSGGTDGVDGPTDAAGAIADTLTLDRSARTGLGAPELYLDENDSYRFFHALGDLVVTGPTDTNVGDIQILLAAPGGRVAGSVEMGIRKLEDA